MPRALRRSAALVGVAGLLLTGCLAQVPPSAPPTTTASLRPFASIVPDASGSGPTQSQPSAPGPSDRALPLAGIGAADLVALWPAGSGLLAGSGPDGQPAIARLTRDGRVLEWDTVDGAGITDLTAFGDDEAAALAGCGADTAIDCEPTLIRTSDGGRSWETWSAGAANGGLRRISFAGGVGWGFAQLPPGDLIPDPKGSVLRRTLDGGRTWRQIDDPCFGFWPDLVDLAFLDARRGWIACGGQGSGTMAPAAIFVTDDGGRSFAIRSSRDVGDGPRLGDAPGGPIESIAVMDDRTAVVAEGRSATERTDDGGLTWRATPPGDPEIVFVDSLAAAGGGAMAALVNDGNTDRRALMVSDDRGLSWTVTVIWPR
ncbi:MAG: hypothetical protein H0U52_01265 [Chloroflexi bacterium]|nr:hypothetical protein [Chloroflexota bacterium]